MKVTIHPLSPDQGPSPFGLAPDLNLIRRLESSFRLMEPNECALAKRFYDRLFERYPALRTMFVGDMGQQAKKLTAALTLVVNHLRDPASIRPMLRDLGRRHVGYGTKPEHYDMVCTTLVECMGELCGEHWSDDLAADWLTALRLVSDAMLEGAAGS